jgi:hypothetical protein
MSFTAAFDPPATGVGVSAPDAAGAKHGRVDVEVSADVTAAVGSYEIRIKAKCGGQETRLLSLPVLVK